MCSWITHGRQRKQRRERYQRRLPSAWREQAGWHGAICTVLSCPLSAPQAPRHPRVSLDHMSPLAHNLLFSSMFHCPFPSFLHFQTLDTVQDSQPLFSLLNSFAEILLYSQCFFKNIYCTTETNQWHCRKLCWGGSWVYIMWFIICNTKVTFLC